MKLETHASLNLEENDEVTPSKSKCALDYLPKLLWFCQRSNSDALAYRKEWSTWSHPDDSSFTRTGWSCTFPCELQPGLAREPQENSSKTAVSLVPTTPLPLVREWMRCFDDGKNTTTWQNCVSCILGPNQKQLTLHTRNLAKPKFLRYGQQRITWNLREDNALVTFSVLCAKTWMFL